MSTPAFTKTIRFKLTLWYTAFLILLGILLIVGINLAMARFGAGISPWQTDGTHSPREIAELVRRGNLKLLRNYSLISFAGVLIVGAVGGYFLSGRMLKPIDHVSSLAAQISSTNLKERINYQGPDDEMKRLADTFDDMLGRLDSAFESQKQFVQDASHELRTPIAIAQANIEVVEMEEKATTEDYERLMEVLKLSLERMNRLSDQLLLLSEGSQDQAKWSVVDMASLLEEVTREFSANAAAAGVGLVVWGSRTLSTLAQPEWRYVPVRRMAIFLEVSIFSAIQWAVFEPNDEELWASSRLNMFDVSINGTHLGQGLMDTLGLLLLCGERRPKAGHYKQEGTTMEALGSRAAASKVSINPKGPLVPLSLKTYPVMS